MFCKVQFTMSDIATSVLDSLSYFIYMYMYMKNYIITPTVVPVNQNIKEIILITESSI